MKNKIIIRGFLPVEKLSKEDEERQKKEQHDYFIQENIKNRAKIEMRDGNGVLKWICVYGFFENDRNKLEFLVNSKIRNTCDVWEFLRKNCEYKVFDFLTDEAVKFSMNNPKKRLTAKKIKEIIADFLNKPCVTFEF